MVQFIKVLLPIDKVHPLTTSNHGLQTRLRWVKLCLGTNRPIPTFVHKSQCFSSQPLGTIHTFSQGISIGENCMVEVPNDAIFYFWAMYCTLTEVLLTEVNSLFFAVTFQQWNVYNSEYLFYIGIVQKKLPNSDINATQICAKNWKYCIANNTQYTVFLDCFQF